MVDINVYLNAIRTATYGKDVRDAILRSIEICYTDTERGLHQLSGVQDVIDESVAATKAAKEVVEQLSGFSAREDNNGDIVLTY